MTLLLNCPCLCFIRFLDLFEKKRICGDVLFFLYICIADIQGDSVPLTALIPPIILPVPSQNLDFQSHHLLSSSVCGSIVWGYRWLFVLLIYVELLTVYTIQLLTFTLYNYWPFYTIQLSTVLHYTIIDRFTLYNYWPFYTIQLLTVLHYTIIDRFTLYNYWSFYTFYS